MVLREGNKDMVGTICYLSLSEADVRIFVRLDVYFAQKDMNVMYAKRRIKEPDYWKGFLSFYQICLQSAQKWSRF